MSDSGTTPATGANTATEEAGEPAVGPATDATETAATTPAAEPETSPGTPDVPPARSGGRGAPVYRERLYLPWYHWFLPLLAAGLLAAEVHMGYPGVRAWLPYLITIPLTALILWRFGSAVVEVRDGELFAGEAHLPLKFAGETQIVPVTAKRKVLGPGFDPAAFALTRSWIGPMVAIRLTDPDDSTPYWLLSTRAPEKLVAALHARD